MGLARRAKGGRMSRTLIAGLGIAIVAGALVGAGWLAGAAHTAAEVEADKTAAAIEANRIYRASAAIGEEAAAQSLSDTRQQEADYANLDLRYKALRKSAGLVVPTVRAYAGPAAGTVAAVQPGVADAPALDRAAPGCAVLPAAGTIAGAAAVPALTLAAVRMWNGALTGQDAAAGACGADAAASAPDPACAQASGLDLDDAWDNHAANAKSCAIDRARHQALINFLKQRESAP